MSQQQTTWQVFRGDHTPDGDRIKQLPPAPPWRQFRAQQTPTTDPELIKKQKSYDDFLAKYWNSLQEKAAEESNARDRLRGESFRIRQDQDRVIQAVNAALSLRRPLLITGKPGSGKTTLAYAVAHELQLGPVLMWPITARTTLEAGLYRYDAIARLQDAQLRKQQKELGQAVSVERNIGDYMQLGPLGTAFGSAFSWGMSMVWPLEKEKANWVRPFCANCDDSRAASLS